MAKNTKAAVLALALACTTFLGAENAAPAAAVAAPAAAPAAAAVAVAAAQPAATPAPMSADEQKYCDTLNGTAKDQFKAMSPEARKAAMKAAPCCKGNK